MARFFEIEKDGIRTAIDEYQFKKIYEPKGWKVIGQFGAGGMTVSSPTDEQEIKNKARMKRAAQKKPFDDHLIKGE